MNNLVFSLKTVTENGKSRTVMDYEKDGRKLSATFDPEKDNEIDLVAKILSGFIDEHVPEKFKAGDKISVAKPATRCFDTAWASANLFGRDLIEYGMGVSKIVEKGDHGEVVRMGKLNGVEIFAVRIQSPTGSYIALFRTGGVEHDRGKN